LTASEGELSDLTFDPAGYVSLGEDGIASSLDSQGAVIDSVQLSAAQVEVYKSGVSARDVGQSPREANLLEERAPGCPRVNCSSSQSCQDYSRLCTICLLLSLMPFTKLCS